MKQRNEHATASQHHFSSGQTRQIRSLKTRHIIFFVVALALSASALLGTANVMHLISGVWEKSTFYILVALLGAVIALYELLFSRMGKEQ